MYRFSMGKVERGKGRFQCPVAKAFPGISALAATVENGLCRVGWNSHRKHCEIIMLLWRAKMAFSHLSIVVLHLRGDARMPPDEDP
jgi:hypothetical protein